MRRAAVLAALIALVLFVPWRFGPRGDEATTAPALRVPISRDLASASAELTARLSAQLESARTTLERRARTPTKGASPRKPPRRERLESPIPPLRNDVAPDVEVSPAAGVGASGVGRTPAPDEGRVPRIMICHPDDRGPFAAADVLQECLDRAPAFSSVDIPPGVYVLHRQVVVSTPLTLRTAGSADGGVSCVDSPDRCAILTAGPDLLARNGFLVVRSTNHVVLEHLVLDGSRGARLASVAAQWCRAGRNSAGFNAAVLGCVGCMLDDVVSRNALCGTGMVWSGTQGAIRRSDFRANGDAATPRMWADGLTAVFASETEIVDNRFIDNSDIGLIVGYGVRARIERNVVRQRTQPVFAGLMLDNFNSDNLGFRGDFRGAVVAGNLVDCGAQLCVFGIQVGPGPWYPSRNIVGGELFDNQVIGAKVGINVDGAGVRRVPTAVFANRVSDVPTGARFSDCGRPIPTGWMNVSPTSVVDRRNDLAPTGASLSDPCQFWSAVSIAE